MATFKPVVQRHQQRKDGRYPVSIRVTNNRKSFYVPTGLYCSNSQINKKSFEIKDPFIIARVAKTISEWERSVLTLNGATLCSMDAKSLKKFVKAAPEDIDFLEEARMIVHDNPQSYSILRTCIGIIEKMGYDRMNINEFNSNFLRKFRNYLDSSVIPVHKNGIIVGHKHYANNTKKEYLDKLCCAFRLIQRKYNTEYNMVVSHNPFFNLDRYRKDQTAKRSMTVEQTKAFFGIKTHLTSERETVDIMKLSFCLCGINLKDIFTMEKTAFDRKNMRITYERHKTRDRSINHSLTSVRIEPEISGIIERYMADENSRLLFDFGRMSKATYSSTYVYRRLSRLCIKYGIDPITPYWFRHTWATIARNECDVSKDDIDLCLAHSGNNQMADVYIRPDWSRVDNANRKVLDLVFGHTE